MSVELIRRTGGGQLGCRGPASGDPIRGNMTKRYIFVPVAYFLFNFSLLAAQNWTEMSDPVKALRHPIDRWKRVELWPGNSGGNE